MSTAIFSAPAPAACWPGLFGAFPGQCQPAAHRHRVRDRRTHRSYPGLFAAAIVLALLAFGATLLQHVPECGARRRPAVRGAAHHPRLADRQRSIASRLGEFLLVVATAAAIIVLPIEQGVAVGIGLSLLHGIWSTTRARLVEFERVPDTTIWWPASANLPGERHPDVAVVVGLQAPLSFLNAENFRADVLEVLKASTPKPGLLVLEASGIVEIDFTAAQTLLDLI